MTTPTRRHRLLALPAAAVLAIAPALLVASPASAATFTVSTEAELITAINDANGTPGVEDTIDFDADITLTADLPSITDDVIIEGDGFELDADGFDAFDASSVALDVVNITITDPEDGIVLLGGGSLTVQDVVITGASGYGINADSVDLTVDATTVSGSTLTNLAYSGPTGLNTVIVTNSAFDDSVDDDGVNILVGGTSTLTITDVTADGNGDFGVQAQTMTNATATLTRVTATNNVNYGIFLGAIGDSRIDASETDGDQNSGGGRATVRDNATIAVTSSGPTSNTGPGWFLESYDATATMTFSSVLATLNTIGVSFSVFNGATIDLSGSLMQGGSFGLNFSTPFIPDPAYGGIVNIVDTDVVGSSIHGLEVDGGSEDLEVTFVDGTIEDVDATNAGAGILADLVRSTLTIERSTIAGNSSTVGGGGIAATGDADSTLRIVNSTFDDNEAPFGSALQVDVDTVEVRHSTIHSSAAVGVLASIDADTSAIVTHSIFEGAVESLQTATATLEVDYSLVENSAGLAATAIAAGTGNLTGVSAGLGALADNGGESDTMLPEAGSPVIDAGAASFVAPPSVDQRGLARVQGGRIDIGAVEQGAALPATGQETDVLGLGTLGGSLVFAGLLLVAVAVVAGAQWSSAGRHRAS